MSTPASEPSNLHSMRKAATPQEIVDIDPALNQAIKTSIQKEGLDCGCIGVCTCGETPKFEQIIDDPFSQNLDIEIVLTPEQISVLEKAAPLEAKEGPVESEDIEQLKPVLQEKLPCGCQGACNCTEQPVVEAIADPTNNDSAFELDGFSDTNIVEVAKEVLTQTEKLPDNIEAVKNTEDLPSTSTPESANATVDPKPEELSTNRQNSYNNEITDNTKLQQIQVEAIDVKSAQTQARLEENPVISQAEDNSIVQLPIEKPAPETNSFNNEKQTETTQNIELKSDVVPSNSSTEIAPANTTNLDPTTTRTSVETATQIQVVAVQQAKIENINQEQNTPQKTQIVELTTEPAKIDVAITQSNESVTKNTSSETPNAATVASIDIKPELTVELSATKTISSALQAAGVIERLSYTEQSSSTKFVSAANSPVKPDVTPVARPSVTEAIVKAITPLNQLNEQLKVLSSKIEKIINAPQVNDTNLNRTNINQEPSVVVKNNTNQILLQMLNAVNKANSAETKVAPNIKDNPQIRDAIRQSETAKNLQQSNKPVSTNQLLEQAKKVEVILSQPQIQARVKELDFILKRVQAISENIERKQDNIAKTKLEHQPQIIEKTTQDLTLLKVQHAQLRAIQAQLIQEFDLLIKSQSLLMSTSDDDFLTINDSEQIFEGRTHKKRRLTRQSQNPSDVQSILKKNLERQAMRKKQLQQQEGPSLIASTVTSKSAVPMGPRKGVSRGPSTSLQGSFHGESRNGFEI